MRRQILTLLAVGSCAIAGTITSAVAFADSTQAPTATTSVSATQQSALAQKLITTAEQYLGYAYAWTGGSPATGFSCIGLVYYVYTVRNGVPSGRNLDEAFASAPQVDRANLRPADLVFFSGTVPGMAPLSHVAIYVGNGKMIAADSYQTGVEWDDLNSTYWSRHYAGATRPLAALGGQAATPPPAPPTAAPTDTPPPAAEVSVNAPPSPSPVAATATKGTTLTVVQPSLVVRSGPDDTYMTITTVRTGDTLTVVQAQDTWYQVALGNDQFGWVPAYGVAATSTAAGATDTPAPTPTPSATPTTAPASISGRVGAVHQTMVVATDTLKIHAVPGPQSQIIGQLSQGTTVVILKVQRDWNMVAPASGPTGWVSSRYLSADLSLASGTGAGPATGTATGPLKASVRVKGFKQKSAYRVGIVTADILRVRASPSTKAALVTLVHQGDRLRIVRSQASWLRVIVRGGMGGWVSAQWVTAETAERVSGYPV